MHVRDRSCSRVVGPGPVLLGEHVTLLLMVSLEEDHLIRAVNRLDLYSISDEA